MKVSDLSRISLVDQLPRPIAYVLAGGASYGAVQVGHLRALARTDITPDFIVGTSVGSLNGAIVAEDPAAAADRLAAFWSTVKREDAFGTTKDTMVRIASRAPSAIDNAPLRRFAESAFHSRDFSELAIPHTAVATDFETGEVVAMNEGDLISAVLASAAIPGVFPVVEREGRRLVDGGLVANVPIGIAAAQGAETIIILDCGLTVIAPQRENTIFTSLVRMAAIFAAQQVRKELDAVHDKTVLYLPGPWPIFSRPDEFKKTQELQSATYDLALEWLGQLHVSGPGRYGAAPSDSLARKA